MANAEWMWSPSAAPGPNYPTSISQLQCSLVQVQRYANELAVAKKHSSVPVHDDPGVGCA
jgi:hypothetical protein